MAASRSVQKSPRPAPASEPPEAVGPVAPAPAEERPRVLVVDDDERNLLAIRNVLEDVAEVIEASSGEKALRHLLKGEFAVILLDVFMPGLDGYETAQMIRAREQTKRIPIVFLSAVNKEAEHLIRGYSMGAVDYVFKPVDPVVLRSKVAVFVDLFSMNREIQRKAREEQRLLDENLRANAELLRAEKELRLAQQRQAAIIESLPIVLYLEPVDRTPRWPSYISGNFASITGYDHKSIGANPGIWEERLHEEDRARVLAALEAREKSGRFSVEYRWRCADGSYKHFHDQAVLLRDVNGAPLQFAGTLLDVTDRKHLESELYQVRKMDAIGKLTGGIAHDFNNLLAAVLGGLGLIERRIELNDEQKRIVGMTRHAAEQGSEVVGRLLAFARRQKLDPQPIDLTRISTNVRNLLAHTLGGLVQLDWEVGEDAWSPFADGAQLELALMNLIINARDAMPDGGRIAVRSDNRSIANGDSRGLAPGDYVLISVEDDGAGIPPDLLEQVTEPFFTTKEVGKGTGLGLSMAYGFARQSGGTLLIDSTVGKGTRVEIWLPRAPEGPRSGKAAAATAAASAGADRPLRILLVDDHPGVRETTAALLEDMGHKVWPACEAGEMIERLRADPDAYDLIISDYAMPLVSGVEAIQRAREIRPDLPAIIITGYADKESAVSRPSDVIAIGKPFTSGQIVAAIRSACPADAPVPAGKD